MLSYDNQQSSASYPPPPPFPRLIWFLLVDSETGEPYKNCSVSSILHSLIAVPVIDQFRDAVHVKNSSILTGIVPAQLFVFKNKAAFDKRNNAKDDGKEQPLKSSRNLDGLGESEEEALIVVVPSPNQTSPFPPCLVPFFNNIGDVTERKGWISFGQERIPSTSLNRLYIRESYVSIASSILQVNGIYKAIIFGTPGIGKSLFLIYLLWRLVKERKRVLFIHGKFNIYYDGNGGVFRFSSARLPLDDADSFWNDTLWCLFDAKDKKDFQLMQLPKDLSMFVVSTSPRREMVNDFKKPPVPQVFYMPIWTESELEKIAPLFPEANNEWRDRFYILGGIPRLIFEDRTKSPTAILNAACAACSLDDCMKIIGIDSSITENSKASHALVHISSKPPFTTHFMKFASPTAESIIIKFKTGAAKHKIQELLAYVEGNTVASVLCGYIFERHAIELLEKGGTFTYRKLVRGNTQTPPDEKMDIPPSTKIIVDKVLREHTFNQLYVPKRKNYPGIDAWIPGIGAFQMTVSQNHNINGRVKNDLPLLGANIKFYFALPPSIYDSFTKKTPLDIDQYAIRIPYPE